MKSFRQLHGFINGEPMQVNVRYDSADPWCVALTFVASPPVTWLVARDLLYEGMDAPAGVGDVRITPGESTVAIRISSPDGESRFVCRKFDLLDLLDSTDAVVPFGTESMDWDTELAALVAGEEQT